MPVVPMLIGKKWRVVEATGKNKGQPAMSKNGKPLDGGGHEDKAKADRQVGYINPPERT